MDNLYIDPLRDLGKLLLTVEKPGRYAGGEYGRLAKREADLRTLIAFPDLYEIGMSNQALRILYNSLNAIPGVSCDRAFAPAPDFEALLRARRLPLYGLDTGVSFADLDILMFTLGYELGITEVLAMLDLGHIPIRNADRNETRPIVIMGGPCVSNPLPFASFIDAFWIGEAEAGYFDLIKDLLAMKQAGAGRGALLEKISVHPNVWSRGKERAFRAVDTDFTLRPARAPVFPVPSIKVVQQHGAVEIMRGCPNGCRFCHAGIWYRPMRQKEPRVIQKEAEDFIRKGGYREISLYSLSSGDYKYIGGLLDSLNSVYREEHISFQLPSLRVSGFSLPILEKISEVRKSGLTFAVETPADAWQLSINKQVSLDNVINILREAKKNGWRGAKFYFMIGLPAGAGGTAGSAGTEEAEIAAFIAEAGRGTGMRFNVNVGVFIPKPHTPYQYVDQIGEEESCAKLDYIRDKLKPLGHKVSVQDPFISRVEGVISRGDERAGDLIEEAFVLGCRLDAWTEYLKKDIWRDIFEKNTGLVSQYLGGRNCKGGLPWDIIESGTATGFLKNEFQRSEKREFTSPCTNNCTHACGLCDKDIKIVENTIQAEKENKDAAANATIKKQNSHTHRIVFSFSKTKSAVFLAHLNVVEVLSMAFIRSGEPVFFTQGFNPLPKLEIVSPLPIGITGLGEIASVDTASFIEASQFMEKMNGVLPEGIRIVSAGNYFIPPGQKKYSLSSLLWGFVYGGGTYVKAGDEKAYRLAAGNETVYGLERVSVLARDILCEPEIQGFPDNAFREDTARTGDSKFPRAKSYFEVYRNLYPNIREPY